MLTQGRIPERGASPWQKPASEGQKDDRHTYAHHIRRIGEGGAGDIRLDDPMPSDIIADAAASRGVIDFGQELGVK
jgi:hypothetical protein